MECIHGCRSLFDNPTLAPIKPIFDATQSTPHPETNPIRGAKRTRWQSPRASVRSRSHRTNQIASTWVIHERDERCNIVIHRIPETNPIPKAGFPGPSPKRRMNPSAPRTNRGGDPA